ncbi:hypothetical protein ACH492_36375 [Streptomyces sp. NPDC019443]
MTTVTQVVKTMPAVLRYTAFSGDPEGGNPLGGKVVAGTPRDSLSPPRR